MINWLFFFLKLGFRKTVCFSEQITSADKYLCIFSCQTEAIVFIILKIFFATHAVLKIGEYSSREVFRPIVQKYLMDYEWIYSRMCVSLLCIALSFFIWSIVGQTKDILGMKKREASRLKLHNCEKHQWKLKYFEFLIALQTNYCLLTLAWSLAAKKLGRKSLELLILANCFHLLNITCNVYFAVYVCQQLTGAKNYFASNPHSF